MSIFSERLKEAMQHAQLSSAQLSKATGIGRSSISQWLSDKYVAKNDKVLQLAQALAVDPQWLMGVESTPTTPITATAEPQVPTELSELWQSLDATGQAKVLKKARKQVAKQKAAASSKKGKKNKKGKKKK